MWASCSQITAAPIPFPQFPAIELYYQNINACDVIICSLVTGQSGHPAIMASACVKMDYNISAPEFKNCSVLFVHCMEKALYHIRLPIFPAIYIRARLCHVLFPQNLNKRRGCFIACNPVHGAGLQGDLSLAVPLLISVKSSCLASVRKLS